VAGWALRCHSPGLAYRTSKSRISHSSAEENEIGEKASMFYRIHEVDQWVPMASLQRPNGPVIGGPVEKRYLPQWSYNGKTWRTYKNLGFSPNGFEWKPRAEEFLDKKNPDWRTHVKQEEENQEI
jgi:hypothetical protein